MLQTETSTAGSSAGLVLPYPADPREEVDDVRIDLSGKGLGGARLLGVDDEPWNLEVLSGLLEPLGCEFAGFNSGQGALETVREWDPDVVLLDVMMPGIDGFEVCRRLKSDPDTHLVPVVMVTALDGRADRFRGIEAGADGFMTKPIDPDELLIRVKSLRERRQRHRTLHATQDVVSVLADTLELKDSGTGAHARRLASQAAELGRGLGLPTEEIKTLEWAGYLHDIGKIGVSEAILQKPGPLTNNEWGAMRQHAELGERLIRDLAGLEDVLPIIRHHHEAWNGSGYPDGLSGEEIPLLARVFQHLDVYDALRTQRPYKPALPRDEVLRLMEAEAGTKLDPALFVLFADLAVGGVFDS